MGFSFMDNNFIVAEPDETQANKKKTPSPVPGTWPMSPSGKSQAGGNKNDGATWTSGKKDDEKKDGDTDGASWAHSGDNNGSSSTWGGGITDWIGSSDSGKKSTRW